MALNSQLLTVQILTNDVQVLILCLSYLITTIYEKIYVDFLKINILQFFQAQAGPPPVHARVRVVNKAGVSDHSELESESEYSQISDYYQEKVRLATTEQTNFTLGLQDSGLLQRQEEEEEMKREEKVRLVL